jgi:hypothetical protein
MVTNNYTVRKNWFQIMRRSFLHNYVVFSPIFHLKKVRIFVHFFVIWNKNTIFCVIFAQKWISCAFVNCVPWIFHVHDLECTCETCFKTSRRNAKPLKYEPLCADHMSTNIPPNQGWRMHCTLESTTRGWKIADVFLAQLSPRREFGEKFWTLDATVQFHMCQSAWKSALCDLELYKLYGEICVEHISILTLK